MATAYGGGPPHPFDKSPTDFAKDSSTKKCTKCKRTKALVHFIGYKKRAQSMDYVQQCVDCRKMIVDPITQIVRKKTVAEMDAGPAPPPTRLLPPPQLLQQSYRPIAPAGPRELLRQQPTGPLQTAIRPPATAPDYEKTVMDLSKDLGEYGKRHLPKLKQELHKRRLAVDYGYEPQDLVKVLREYDARTEYDRLDAAHREQLLHTSPEVHHNRLVASNDAAYHNTTAKIGFLKIAPEVRNVIYDLIIPRSRVLGNHITGAIVVITKGARETAKPTHGFEPTILSICRFVRAEATPLYHGRQTVHYVSHSQYSCLNHLQDWISKFGVERFQHIRRLELNIKDDNGMDLAFRIMGDTYSASATSFGRSYETEIGAALFSSVLEKVKQMMGERNIVPPANRLALRSRKE